MGVGRPGGRGEVGESKRLGRRVKGEVSGVLQFSVAFVIAY